jgi:hypothetical protein
MDKTETRTDSPNRMTDPGFLEFLGSRRLTSIIGDDPYTVGSESGQTYHVSLHWRSDRYTVGSLSAFWRCNCAAHKTCRHIDAVVDMRWAEAAAADDYDGMDIMELEEF